MRIIKTSSYSTIEWHHAIDKVLEGINSEINSQWRKSLPQYERDELDKERIISEAINDDFIPFVPSQFKDGEQNLLPEFKNQVRNYVIDKYDVDPFPGDDFFVSDEEMSQIS